MSARTQPRPRPASNRAVDTRLPWWALALPALAFVVLLALILNPSDAHAAAGDPAITRLLEHMRQLLSR
ncbi:hypothetical protein [Streptomyces sp.]|uniref:hypothetical protein n=1 Tax=Streptomyces sp. TaxID=1931 RepID=UPI002D65FA01|nr:hypothetical protein [Streptomyces sp.]HZF87151.1 hypothetical protein [Streptomyces sp.]